MPAGPILLWLSLSHRFHSVGGRKIVRTVTRGCIVCRRQSARPTPQIMGRLPVERVTPGPIFDKVGVDFPGPLVVKYGHVRRPTLTKTYVCVFISLSVKAVHLQPVTDLTSDAFIACLRCFVSSRGKPSLILSDHGTTFAGAKRELQEFMKFLEEQKTQRQYQNFA